MSFAITRQDGVLCYATNSDVNNGNDPLMLTSTGEISIDITNCILLSGTYMLNVALTSKEGEVYDDLQRVLFFKIDSEQLEQGVCRICCEWTEKGN